MKNRITHNMGGFSYQPQPSQQPPPPPLPWALVGPQNPLEQWQLARRIELKELAIPFAMALLNKGDGLQATADSWGEKKADSGDEIAERAAELALKLQAALDRARPRS